MTKEELATTLDQCRRQANRASIIIGFFGIIFGGVAIATVIVSSRGGLSRENFLISAGLILLLNFAAFAWGMRRLRQLPEICGAVCPNCGKSLAAQRDSVLATGICIECKYNIIRRPNQEDTHNQ